MRRSSSISKLDDFPFYNTLTRNDTLKDQKVAFAKQYCRSFTKRYIREPEVLFQDKSRGNSTLLIRTVRGGLRQANWRSRLLDCR